MIMKNFFMRYLLLTIGILPCWMMGQNPLKKELKGSNTTVFYSPSTFHFTNYSNQSILVADLNDNRSANWNKQINDSIRIDLIRDFWNYPYKTLFKNKINQDLSKANVKVDYTPGEGQYVVEPTVDAHFPNFVSYPRKGYYVYTKVNMKVLKNGVVQFNKAYQDYYFFSKGHPNFSDDFNKDYPEGTNTAMWIGMRTILDKFYSDLNDLFAGKSISNDNTPLAINAIESNISADKNLTSQQKSYTDAKDKKIEGAQVANNYKMDEPVNIPPPVPSNDNLDKAIGSLGKVNGATSAPKNTSTSMKDAAAGPVKLDSTALAIRASKELARRKAIDSAQKVKTELMLASKVKSSLDKVKRDSILKTNRLAIAEKLRAKSIQDSLKKAEINQKIEQAKVKREEEKKKLQAKSSPSSIAALPAASTSSEASIRTSRPSSNRSTNISEEIKRIAQEVEEEEKTGVVRRPSSAVSAASTSTFNAEEVKREREMKLNALKAEREAKLAALKAESEKKAIAFKAAQEAKIAKEAAEKKEKLAKLEEEKKAQLAILTAKNYVADSIKLEDAKRKKREAIVAAQRAAVEAERRDLSKNPNAGQLFATVSTDPPSKLPEYRTREQILADRIFVPKNETSKNLLARVKLITPEEEMSMLSQLKSSELSSVDSVFIEYQKTRPMPSLEVDTVSSKNAATPMKSKDNSKSKSESKQGEVKNPKTTSIDLKANATKSLAKATESKKEETKKEIVEKSLKATSTPETPKTEAPKVEAQNAATKTPTEMKIERMDDDIRKKAEELKKKAQAGVK